MELPANEAESKQFASITRALKTLSAGNRTLLRASGERALLQDMCDVIVGTGGYRMAFVGYAEHDERKSIRWMAGVGTRTDLAESNAFSWADTESEQTVMGTVIRTGQAVVGRNILSASAFAGTLYARLLAQAREYGYASITGFPLFVEGKVLGALVILAAEPDAFDAAEVCLLGQLADDLAYGIAHLRMSVRDRDANATIARLAFYDGLTGLPNRTRLLDTLYGAIAAAKERNGPLALLHFEVGRFREINKVLGYRSGDELLLELSRRLQPLARADETLARVGEAEFALLLPTGDADYAVQAAQRLLTTLREPVVVAGLTLDARVDIGIALYPDHASDADALIRRANAAMHEVRPTHGGFAMYTGGQEQRNTRRLALMGDLHRAIRQNELRLYCQPKVDVASRRLCGAEALVRWEHPSRGMIPAVEFIPLAEQAGMITPLTNWVLDAALSQASAWTQAGIAWPLAVNLSAHDLFEPSLIDRIGGLFSTWGIAPQLIQLELTESALMADPAGALDTLSRLKRLGVKLFVDDYGTGYSSLSYLQRLPVDAIKIDQSFVMPMVSCGDSSVIVSSTIELGHNLGMEVVAEGVETQAIWDRLAALRCDVAQGYLISRPVPSQQLRQWEIEWSAASRFCR